MCVNISTYTGESLDTFLIIRVIHNSLFNIPVGGGEGLQAAGEEEAAGGEEHEEGAADL